MSFDLLQTSLCLLMFLSRSGAAGRVQDIMKQLTVNSLILSVNLQELPRAAQQGSPNPLAEQVPGTDPAAVAALQGYGPVVETPAGPQVLTAALSIGQAGALGLVRVLEDTARIRFDSSINDYTRHLQSAAG